MSKYAYLIESIAPLVFRSGKPFGSLASAQDVVFPMPSSSAGLIRALSVEQGSGQFQDYANKLKDEDYQKLLSIESQGPFLVRFNPNNESNYTILLPKPANAIYFEDKVSQEIHVVRLSPEAFNDERCGSDLPKGLLPVQMQKELKGKPHSGLAYWSLQHFLAWQQGQDLTFKDVETEGLKSLPIEIRTHVALDDVSFASDDGKLFQTASFDFNHAQKKEGDWQGWQEERLGFLILTAQQLNRDLATFGGERRLSYLKPVELNQELQHAPQDLVNSINQAKGFCLTMLTPCIFEQGYIPQWINAQTFQGIFPNTKIKVQLKAVAIDRWLAVSGWDSIVWKPKATRKAVSAGSVYWFELIEDSVIDQNTIQQVWASSLADHEQDRHDGFGMVTLALWKK